MFFNLCCFAASLQIMCLDAYTYGKKRLFGGKIIPANSTEFSHHVTLGAFEKNMKKVHISCGGTLLTMRSVFGSLPVPAHNLDFSELF